MTRRITRLDEILNEAESQHLEFKAVVPSPEVLARHMAAFANADGGTIALGIDEGRTAITPVSRARALNHYERARRLLSPEPHTELYQLDSLRGNVMCIDVAPSETGPVVVGGVILRRDGAQIRPASAGELRPMLTGEPSGSATSEAVVRREDRIAEILAEQSAKLEEIQQNQLEARSWSSRLPDIVISGIVGAVLGVLMSALFL